MQQQLEFKISSGLKDIIGRDLITDDFIAVFELVKNSYDANASNVHITFEDNKIIIQDDGKGMSLDEIKDKWLFVAYSAKKTGEEDKDHITNDYRKNLRPKKYYAGAKGIGRFSCDRLGQYLTLTTRKAGAKNAETIKIDWKQFEEDLKKKFVDIKVTHEVTVNKSTSFKKGTILEITNLHSSWPRHKLQELKYSLEKLINPFGQLNQKNKENFSINITCVREKITDSQEKFKRNKVNGSVESFIFETLNVKTTQIKTEINKDYIQVELIDRGTPIYKIKEVNKEYKLIENATYNLFFLNQAAKINFSRQMGFQPVQFGSVFLFKNGFRVHPFGNIEDDSWGLDYRKQQGYARFLGTRDLLGRVELQTDNSKEFREVSSRDGGLVKTDGYHQLIDSFIEKCLKRLEKYVVDVQWNYKDDKNLGEDKDAEDISVIASSVSGRAQLVGIIKKLADNKNIEIISYNKNLVNILNDKLENVKPEIFKSLNKIAERTNDQVFSKEIITAEKRYKKLLEEKIEAEKKAEEERFLREFAEAEAKIAEEARLIEEERRRKAEEARRLAELETREKELKRKEEELKRIEAEKKAQNAIRAQKSSEASLKAEKEKNKYLTATRKSLSDDAEELIHSIKLSATEIDACIDALNRKIKEGLKDDKVLLEEISLIKFQVDKVLKISNLITKANFKSDQEIQKINLSDYIEEYISTYSHGFKEKIKIRIHNNGNFNTRISLLDVAIIIDNLISNSIKSKAKEILIEMNNKGKSLIVDFHDDGQGVSDEFKDNYKSIFSLGITTTHGSGIGLYTVKNKMESMDGQVQFLGNSKKLKGASFRLIFL